MQEGRGRQGKAAKGIILLNYYYCCSFGRLPHKLCYESRARKKTKNKYKERDLQARSTLTKSVGSGRSNCFHNFSSTKFTYVLKLAYLFFFCFRHRLSFAQFLQLFSEESASTRHFQPLKTRYELQGAFRKYLLMICLSYC